MLLTVSNSSGSDTHNKNRYLVVHKDFSTGSLTDYDGNSYSTVQIGDQVWMAENLKVTHYPDGGAISNIKDSLDWANLGLTDEAYCYYNNGNGKKYGGLYTYAAANKACPTGWHLPSHDEWKALEAFMETDEKVNETGVSGNLGKKLKATTGWEFGGDGMNGTNDYGFTALPGGHRTSIKVVFDSKGCWGDWWSSSDGTDFGFGQGCISRSLNCGTNDILLGSPPGNHGLSVRCVKD